CGTIKNISAGGLGLSHIDNCEEITELSSLYINLISEKLYSEKIQCRSIWSSKEEGGFTTSRVHIRCSGIAFEQLNNKMRAQLNEFITSLNGRYRVGGGVTPAASHTTGHTVPYHGGSLR
ncbi:MAG: PilZ domain-containing protein, partial [Planctomycetota bacterium]